MSPKWPIDWSARTNYVWDLINDTGEEVPKEVGTIAVVTSDERTIGPIAAEHDNLSLTIG